MAYQDFVIDGFLIVTLSLFLLPYFSSWDLYIPEFSTVSIFNSLQSLQYKISIYCSMAVSVPMILELVVRVVLEPKLLIDFKTFISNVFLFLTLLLPDLIILTFVIPYLDLKLFNLAFEGRFILSIWSLGKFLYKYGDNCFFQNKFFITIFGLLCINRILVYYSYFFNFSAEALWITGFTMFLGFLIYGIQMTKWYLYLSKRPNESSLTTDQYLCNIYIISASFVFISMLILYFIFIPSMNWLDTNANYLSGSTYLFSLFYVQVTVFQGRALQREAVAVKSTLAVKRMFLRYMSHEIRTPLNTMMLGLQYLQEDMVINGDSAERLGVLQDIKQSCDVATKTLNDMLLYDKIETGVMELDRSEVRILDFIRTTLQPFHIQALQEGISLSIQLVHGVNQEQELEVDSSEYERLLATTLLIDPNKLAQVIRNLISNALKFTPRGGAVTVRLYKSTLQQQNKQQKDIATRMKSSECICMDVVDTGPGISIENQARLFHGVIQFSPGEMQEGGGSGLGLYISKGIVDAHQGQLSVASKGLGHGSTFSLQVPVPVAVAVAVPPPSGKDPGQGRGYGRRHGRGSSQVRCVSMTDSLPAVDESDIKLFRRFRATSTSSRKIMNYEDVDQEDSEAPPRSLPLPRGEARSSALSDSSSPSPSAVVSPLLFTHPKFARVLVVDDVAMNRKMLLRLLRDRFESHCEACNGQEAVDKVRDSMSSGIPFDVITMDYQMPVMDGTKAARAIRELGYKGVIVGVTGNALPEDIRTFMSQGANEVLTKPIDIADFDKVLLRCTRRVDAFA